jgi:hypothetical protein
MPDDQSTQHLDMDFLLRVGAMEGTVRTMERDIESLKADVGQIKEQQAVNTTTINAIDRKLDQFLAAQESSSDSHKAHESATERIAKNPWKRPIGEIVADCAMTALKWAITAAFVALLVYAFSKIGSSPVAP